MTADKPPRTLDELAVQRLKLDKAGDWQLTVVQRQYLSPENPQFSILELMLITGICAVTITAITAVGIYGVFGLFFGCFFMWVYLRSSLTNPTKLRFWNQFMWGILMPIGCIFGDPFVFGNFDMGAARHFNEYAFGCYAFIGWEIFCLAVSCFVKPAQSRLNRFLAGALLAGAIFAFVIAIAILPITMIGLLLVLGTIGFTPWFTAIVYLRTAMMHWRRANAANDARHAYWFVLAGFLFSIFLAAIVYVITLPILTSQPYEEVPFLM